MAGATLVPKPAGSSLLGADLSDYLRDQRITALCCVPTLLATIEEDLPGLSFLLVSGEACPRDLIARWHRSDRRFLNVYGPTEATVTATLAVADPDRSVTLGVPLPTYSAVILDPEEDRALAIGETGEIGLAGVGLARGYINRQDLTERAFIADFLQLENNPSGRIYRTGDLGRINSDGEIEYFGRIDTQVKIRGYRIELTEIESVLLQAPDIAQAVVSTHEPEPGFVELAAYYTLRHDVAALNPQEIYAMLRVRLPGYMVPAYFEQLASIPMMASGKADRKRLPRPVNRLSLAGSGTYTAPATPMEDSLAAELGTVLHLDRVSTDAHFFNDLGANSLLMAHFCARVRKHPEIAPPAMQDVYLNPSVRQLASFLSMNQPAIEDGTKPLPERIPTVLPSAGTAQYVLCGALQLLIFLGYLTWTSLLLVLGYEWISAGSDPVQMWVRSIGFGAASFVVLSLIPVLMKWILVGRWKAGRIRIWSLAYVRFWTVKTLIQANPMVLFAGSPLYVLYLRMLGAKIGKGVVIFSRMVPACTDLLTVGEGTVIHKNSFFLCWRARSGVIEIGPVTLGRNVLISEKTTLDIGTSMGNGAQLGHASSLQTSQSVPDGQAWHGSPAAPTDTNYLRVEPVRCSTRRRVIYSLLQLANRLLLVFPVALAGLSALLPGYLDTGHLRLDNPGFYLDTMLVTLTLFIFGFIGGLVIVLTVPRLLSVILKPDTTYPLYGLHYSFQRTVARISNLKLYKDVFGDSSYIVHYLSALGYDLGEVEQTGSNFGPEVAHESPRLCSVGTGTMVSDGLNLMNADFSSTSFRLTRARIAPRNFLGNDLTFPSGARVGENCLLATKVMIPIDGPVRTGVGLLGSPPFEIPRAVLRDTQFDELKIEEAKNRLLPAKNRHNIISMALFLLVRWFVLFVATLLGTIAATLHGLLGVLAISLMMLSFLVFQVLFSVLVERAVMGFRHLTPQYCSIYDSYFWRHERLWKLLATPPFNGTPFKAPVWRMLGVKVGKRLYDAGVNIPEKTLVTIGDDCALNQGTAIQGHSLEDGTFKSDYIVLGDRCTLGVESFVNYGVTMGNDVVLEADSLLMKGEDVPSQSVYTGNPARETRGSKPAAFLPAGPRHRADNRGIPRGPRPVHGSHHLPSHAARRKPVHAARSHHRAFTASDTASYHPVSEQE